MQINYLRSVAFPGLFVFYRSFTYHLNHTLPLSSILITNVIQFGNSFTQDLLRRIFVMFVTLMVSMKVKFLTKTTIYSFSCVELHNIFIDCKSLYDKIWFHLIKNQNFAIVRYYERKNIIEILSNHQMYLIYVYLLRKIISFVSAYI